MTGNEIRKTFLDFFAAQGHQVVPSASLLPEDDPTLLFTNAGMNQFKKVFLGLETRPYPRAVSAQKCIRVSGKHNDLEEVGQDTYHHTFFEMLGNWSFGDYYKREAIDFAWTLLTSVFAISPDRLWVTVFRDDHEAAALWPAVTGISAERVGRYDEKDNFWEMADTGPCGPCSEIFLDLGPEIGCGRADCGPNCPHCDAISDARFIEIWNLVFIQFNRDPDGRLEELPAKHVDTGLGFERMVAFLQGVRSNYDTDLFQPLIRRLQEITGYPYRETGEQTPFRVIADHLRALTFAIADGAIPSNEGRGYVLRRILRRAARFGRSLDMHEPFIYQLVATLVESMGEAYPEIRARQSHIEGVIRAEEAAFGQTLDRGIELFEAVATRVMRQGQSVIPGEDVFQLYDTYGFPPDLTQLMAAEKGLSVDLDGFEQAMEQQRRASREAARFASAGPVTTRKDWITISPGEHSLFVGYDTLITPVVIRKIRSSNGTIQLIFDQTPFYAEAGGQVGDSGDLRGGGLIFQLTDTTHDPQGIVHHATLAEGKLDLTASASEHLAAIRFEARVDESRRLATMRNHTATHLLHKALQEILGDHVRQAGSLVAPDRLRFDFTHFFAVERHTLDEIERLVNQKVMANLPVEVFYTDLETARARGAMALFGEKYDQKRVRVVKIGNYSMELCGGTHLEATGQIGLFRLVREGGIAAGVRRVEALTGTLAYQYDKNREAVLQEAAVLLKAEPHELVQRVTALLERNRELEREVRRLQRASAGSWLDRLVADAGQVDGVVVLAGEVEVPDLPALRNMADAVRNRLQSLDPPWGIGVLGARMADKVSFVAVATDALIEAKGWGAGDIIGDVARIAGGGGGGKKHLAQAGGRDVEKLPEALRRVPEIIRARLTRPDGD